MNQGGKLQNRSSESGADFSGNSRAATYFDFDSDGDLDVLVNNYNMPAMLLRNNAERLHHNWLRIRLQGDPGRGSNRDAVGARLDVVLPNGKHVWREVQGGTGYLSMNPKAQMIGLGTEKEADVTVYWPDGNREVFRHLRANEEHRLDEGSKTPYQKQSAAGR